MHVCFCGVCFSFLEIGWEERLQYDFCLCLVGRKTLTLSVMLLAWHFVGIGNGILFYQFAQVPLETLRNPDLLNLLNPLDTEYRPVEQK